MHVDREREKPTFTLCLAGGADLVAVWAVAFLHPVVYPTECSRITHQCGARSCRCNMYTKHALLTLPK